MSSQRQGFLRRIKISAGVFRHGINLWPPFVGAGIRVTRVTRDFRKIDVKLSLGMLNRNYFGTQFGGSMFAMTDPFFALMMFHNLGSEYVVWDKSATIEYRKPGRGDVHARFVVPASVIDDAKRATANGDKHEPVFDLQIVDDEGDVVADVAKTLYVRRRAPDARKS